MFSALGPSIVCVRALKVGAGMHSRRAGPTTLRARTGKLEGSDARRSRNYCAAATRGCIDASSTLGARQRRSGRAQRNAPQQAISDEPSAREGPALRKIPTQLYPGGRTRPRIDAVAGCSRSRMIQLFQGRRAHPTKNWRSAAPRIGRSFPFLRGPKTAGKEYTERFAGR